MDQKRLFLGLEVNAPWPSEFPYGRLIDSAHRHVTLAFLGNIDFQKMEKALQSFPIPSFALGFAGYFDQCLFLPPRHPRVAAWHVTWSDRESELVRYQKTLIEWLKENDFAVDTRHRFLPHVTLCRSPFKERSWQRAFAPLPLIAHTIHLFESVGNLKYVSLWHHSLLSPFDEKEHTADLAFTVKAESYKQLFMHAATALCFHFPPLLSYIPSEINVVNLEEVIISLNQMVGSADGAIGCPFKAVSFHNKMSVENGIIQWEMIIDV